MNESLSSEEREAVYQILVDQLDVRRDQITEDAHLEQDLGADSLDEMEIVMALEGRFQLTIPDEEAERAKTVRAIFDLLEQHLRAGRAA